MKAPRHSPFATQRARLHHRLPRLASLALACAGLCLGAMPAQAITFAQAYEAARSYDANFRAAGHERDAIQQGVPIARASLLPTLNLTASDSTVQGTRQFANSLNQEVRTRLDYQAPQAALTLRMPLLNYEAFNVYKQAQVQTELADEQFRTQGMDLMDRLAGAYLQVVLAREALILAQAQTAAMQTQLAQTTQREARGEGTRVQVAQAQASLDMAQTRVLEASDQRDLATRQLARLTGLSGAVPPPLPADAASAAPTPLFPQRLGDWLDLAVRQSPQLRLRERATEVARLGVRRQYAGHLPRLDLVGSLSRSQNDSSSNVGQQTQLRSMGVQLTVPLFNGGGVEASIKQAQAREKQADEDLRSEREALEVDIQRHYQAVHNGQTKIVAYSKAVDSTALALQGARRAQELGQGTASEVADLQAQHLSAKRELAQARVEQLLSRLRLMVRAGAPMDDVAADLDAALMSLPAPKATTAEAAAATPAPAIAAPSAASSAAPSTAPSAPLTAATTTPALNADAAVTTATAATATKP